MQAALEIKTDIEFCDLMNQYIQLYSLCNRLKQDDYPIKEIKMPNYSGQFVQITQLVFNSESDRDIIHIQELLCNTPMNNNGTENYPNYFKENYSKKFMYVGINKIENMQTMTKHELCNVIDDMINEFYFKKHDASINNNYFRDAIITLFQKDESSNQAFFPKFCNEENRRKIEYNVVFSQENRKLISELFRFMKNNNIASIEQLETERKEYLEFNKDIEPVNESSSNEEDDDEEYDDDE